jgi:ABC-type multidrug transport system fused ATPase/permease subunit
MKKSVDFTDILPVLALYTFAGYRLMPSIQNVYAAISTLRYAQPGINALYDDTKSLSLLNKTKNKTILQFNKSINLKHIHFQYFEASRTALKDININISANSTVGLVGATGSGKTTLVDIVLGLLEPYKGSLEVDGEIINENNRRNWQQSIGYVPQFIYLSDDTVEANIAFGVDPKDINKDAILSVAKIANLHEFFINELPKKYETYVGERGVRLSGGQRQRIGIARALYHNPKLLILDEATSSLDNLTEKVVMEAIHNLGNKITIILIAHRLSTVKKCDKIILLDNGQVKDEGTFEKLFKTNEQFKKSAENT